MLNSILSAKPKSESYGESAALDLYLFLTEELCNTQSLNLGKLRPALHLLYLTGRLEKKTLDALIPITDSGPLRCTRSGVDGACTYTGASSLSTKETRFETFRPIEDLGCFIISSLWSDRLCKEVLPRSVEGLKENGIREKTHFPKWFHHSSPAALEQASYINGHLLLTRDTPLGYSELVLHSLSAEDDPDDSLYQLHTDSEVILSKNLRDSRRTINAGGKWYYWKETDLISGDCWSVIDLDSGEVRKTEIDRFLCTDEEGFDYVVSKGLIQRIIGKDQSQTVFLYDPDSRYIPWGKGILEMNEISKINTFVIYHDTEDSRTAAPEEIEQALFHCLMEFDRPFRSLFGKEGGLLYHMKIGELSQPPRPFTAKALSSLLKERWHLLAQNIPAFSRKYMFFCSAADRHLFDHPQLTGEDLYDSICRMLKYLEQQDIPGDEELRTLEELRQIRRPKPILPPFLRSLRPDDMGHMDWFPGPEDDDLDLDPDLLEDLLDGDDDDE